MKKTKKLTSILMLLVFLCHDTAMAEELRVPMDKALKRAEEVLEKATSFSSTGIEIDTDLFRNLYKRGKGNLYQRVKGIWLLLVFEEIGTYQPVISVRDLKEMLHTEYGVTEATRSGIMKCIKAYIGTDKGLVPFIINSYAGKGVAGNEQETVIDVSKITQILKKYYPDISLDLSILDTYIKLLKLFETNSFEESGFTLGEIGISLQRVKSVLGMLKKKEPESVEIIPALLSMYTSAREERDDTFRKLRLEALKNAIALQTEAVSEILTKSPSGLPENFVRFIRKHSKASESTIRKTKEIPLAEQLVIEYPFKTNFTEEEIKEIIIQSAYGKLEKWIKLKDWPGAALVVLIIKELDPENEVIKGIEESIRNGPALKMLNWHKTTKVDRHFLKGVVAKVDYFNNINISLRNLMQIFYLRDVIKKEVWYRKYIEKRIPEYINQSGSDEKVPWLSAVILSAISDRNIIEHIEGRKYSIVSLDRVSMEDEVFQKPKRGRPPKTARTVKSVETTSIRDRETTERVEIKIPFELVTWSEFERAIILETLNIFKNNKGHAADALDITVKTLRNKLEEYNKSKELLTKDLSVRLPPQGARLEDIERIYFATSYRLAKDRGWAQSYLAEKVLGVSIGNLRKKGIFKDYTAIIREYGEGISIQLLDEDILSSEARVLFSKLQEALEIPLLRQERYLMQMITSPEDVQAAKEIIAKSSLMTFDNRENSKKVLGLIELIRIILDRQEITDEASQRKILDTTN